MSSSITRRDLLKLPIAAAVPALILPASAATPYSMPGLFPSRVVAVKHSGASVNMAYQTAPIQNIIRRGMMELTGQSNYIAAWRTLFQPGDTVGIKVNPCWIPAVTTSPACLLEILSGLLLAGVSPSNIIIYERYEYLLSFIKGWLPAWVKTTFATPGYYVDDQRSMVGYDPSAYFESALFLKPFESPSVPADTRSYLAQFVTRQATKIISLASLKDHQAAGVTLNLKNLTAGCVNNWNRFHDGPVNDMVGAIPGVAAVPALRNKVVLGIIDGVHCLCDGGPLNYADPKYGFVTELNTMYFATDIVACDRVGWLAINAERAKKGLLPEETAGADGYDVFPVRQPQHITVAGEQYGLGEWRDDHIDLHQITLA
jgi:hypothetical protein